MSSTTRAWIRGTGMSSAERFVVFASSIGTVFEWYDFYLYAVLAPFFASLFFPAGNDTAALLAAFATYAAGFVVRPFGALLFGRIGDLVGRKYTFLVTIIVMGSSTFLVGLLPTYARIGWLSPVLLVTLRLLQGLAVGGEYGGAATYVGEHARSGERGYATSWIQTTATGGLALALIIIIGCRQLMPPKAFSEWGWRIPFVLSVILLLFSLYIRLKLSESPIFLKMKDEGKGSKSPLIDSFVRYPNNKFVLLATLGATAGMGVVWYTGQFYALFFLTITLKVSYLPAYLLVLVALLIGMPLFVFVGGLSDRIGRLKIILAGCLLAALTFFPLFDGLTHYANPDLESFSKSKPVTVYANASTCQLHIFVTAFTQFSSCDRARDLVTNLGVSFKTENVPEMGSKVTLKIGTVTMEGFDANRWNGAFVDAGYPNLERDGQGKVAPKSADTSKINWFMTELILLVMMIYAAMVYGPIAAFLVELFPTRIRYSSISMPYHIGAGVFGGMLPLLATAVAAATGNIYAGLWYSVIVALMTVVIGGAFLRETKDVDIVLGSGVEAAHPARLSPG
jgi:MFS family permease